VNAAAATDYLTLDDVLEIASGVLGDVQIRDLGLLASAVERPSMTAFGEDAYPRFVDKAGALMHSLARNHPLTDGNKRLAWSATRAFCLLNGCDIRYMIDGAEAFVLAVAAAELDVPAIAVWLGAHLEIRHSTTPPPAEL
jgi:death-on-curing protein